MPGILVYLPYCFLVMCTLAHTSVPLFLWSGAEYFRDGIELHPEVNGFFQLDHFIQDFMGSFGGKKNSKTDSSKTGQDSLMNYVSKTNKIMPEVVVAFVYSKMDSADAARQSGAYSSTRNHGALSFLKEALTQSKSSLTVPHVLIERSTTSTSVQLTDVFSSLEPTPEIVALELTGGKNEIEDRVDENLSGCKVLLDHVNGNKWMFSNLVTDLIMVKADDFKDVHKDCITMLMDEVNTLTSGHFVAMLTADMAKTDIVKFFPTSWKKGNHLEQRQRPVLLASQGAYILSAATTNSTTWPGVKYVTGNILFALLLGLFMLITVLCGVNCLLSIETPQRLSRRKYNIGKQN